MVYTALPPSTTAPTSALLPVTVMGPAADTLESDAKPPAVSAAADRLPLAVSDCTTAAEAVSEAPVIGPALDTEPTCACVRD
jgi:hypothetical protein